MLRVKLSHRFTDTEDIIARGFNLGVEDGYVPVAPLTPLQSSKSGSGESQSSNSKEMVFPLSSD